MLAERSHDPYRAAVAARELAQLAQAPAGAISFTAYARCKRIVRTCETYALAPEHYTEAATRGLYEAWQRGRGAHGARWAAASMTWP